MFGVPTPPRSLVARVDDLRGLPVLPGTVADTSYALIQVTLHPGWCLARRVLIDDTGRQAGPAHVASIDAERVGDLWDVLLDGLDPATVVLVPATNPETDPVVIASAPDDLDVRLVPTEPSDGEPMHVPPAAQRLLHVGADLHDVLSQTLTPLPTVLEREATRASALDAEERARAQAVELLSRSRAVLHATVVSSGTGTYPWSQDAPSTIHTDGSVLHGSGCTGTAALTDTGAWVVSRIRRAYTADQAELAGILWGVLTLARAETGRTVVLSDSVHAIRAVRRELSGPVRPWRATSINAGTTEKLLVLIHMAIDLTAVDVQLKWVRGHDGDCGNELADRCARAAARHANAGLDSTRVDAAIRQILASRDESDDDVG